MSRLFVALLLACSSLPTLLAAESPMWDALTPQQQEQLSSGRQVMLEEEVADNPWPRFVIYHVVNSSPEKVAAVFWDCELDSKYVPNCLSVRLVSKPEPWVHEGEYTLKMPFLLPNEVYLSRNELKVPESNTYEISWSVLQARYIKGSKGTIKIEPYGEKGNQALLRYGNLVIPGSKFASLLRAKAATQVSESVKAFVSQVESEMQKSPQLIDKQVQEMETALKSIPAGK